MTDVAPRHTGSPATSDAHAARYDELAALAGGSHPRFDRAFRTRLHVLDDGWLSLTELDDDFHSMRVALRIAPDGTITAAAGKMLRHPFDTCPRAIEALASVVGSTVARPGAHNQIKERMPRDEGCLHIADMLTVAFRAFRIAKGHDIPWEYKGEESRRTFLTMMPNIRDTCVSFAIAHDD